MVFRPRRRNIGAGGRACNQGERADPLGCAHGSELRDASALGQSEQVGPVDAERVEQTDDIVSQVFEPIVRLSLPPANAAIISGIDDGIGPGVWLDRPVSR
jgi:hypothetical protein